MYGPEAFAVSDSVHHHVVLSYKIRIYTMMCISDCNDIYIIFIYIHAQIFVRNRTQPLSEYILYMHADAHSVIVFDVHMHTYSYFP